MKMNFNAYEEEFVAHYRECEDCKHNGAGYMSNNDMDVLVHGCPLGSLLLFADSLSKRILSPNKN